MPFVFENLRVYQKAVDFAEKTSNLTDSFPRGNYYLSDQLNRAALSISANLAEGNGKFTANDKRSFFYISRGSTHECVPLLEVAKRKKLINSIDHEDLKKDLEV